MRKMKLKIIVKMRKRDSFKDNNDVDFNDDAYEDICKVRELKIGQEDEENEDEEDETEDNSEDEEKG